jgi:hypothetical protein
MLALHAGPPADQQTWSIDYDDIPVGRVVKLAGGLYQVIGLDGALWAVRTSFRETERWIAANGEAVMDGSIIDQEPPDPERDWFSEPGAWFDDAYDLEEQDDAV